jgi:non-heme chloroperoxidase
MLALRPSNSTYLTGPDLEPGASLKGGKARRTAFRAVKWVLCISLMLVANAAWAADSASLDRSPHRVQMVAAAPNVELETLDWGGSGRPIVLIAGLGGTAHVFDDLAPKLRGPFHVYGITRRGFGKSSVPQDGYGTDRLADDILGTLDALKIKHAVLVGHSIGGLELSAFAARHPERVDGLVYLDTTYLFDPGDQDLFGIAEWRTQLEAVRKRLDALDSQPNDPAPIARPLIDCDWPAFQQDLQTLLDAEKARSPFTPPGPTDLASFAAFRAWFARVRGFAPPEAELREQFVAGDKGEVASQKSPQWVSDKILAGQKKYTGIASPILAIFVVQSRTRVDLPNDEASRKAVTDYVKIATARADRRANGFKHDMPSAKIVFIDRAPHHVFLSNEADVLREIRSFIGDLQRTFGEAP